MTLFFRELGNKKQPLIILHGLFGSSDNWMTQAKMLAEHFHVYLPDQRNHGQSGHSAEMNYHVLADDLHEFIVSNSISAPVLLGHSMGGKAAMFFALKHPELVSKLIVVDMAPRKYPIHHRKILDGLKAIPLPDLQSRNHADDLLSAHEPDASVRQFLLKNLQRKPEGGFMWKINLPVLDSQIEHLGEAVPAGKFDKPALFIKGKHSNYVSTEDEVMIRSIFPQAEIITMDTGHWVQAEKPQEFVDHVLNYLQP